MALPPKLLHLVETHPCFSGVWRDDTSATTVIDPIGPPRQTFILQCEDCLMARIAVDTTLLTPGLTGASLAAQVTDHVRQHRGYASTIAGYHGGQPGLWLSAAYWASLGTFVLSSRSGNDLDALLELIRRGAWTVPDPRMSQASLYALHRVYLSVVPPPKVASVSALLASSHVTTQRKAGTCRVTLAVFGPAQAPASPSAPVAATSSPAIAPAKASRRIGDLCPVCGETVQVRPLFHSTYVGCACG